MLHRSPRASWVMRVSLATRAVMAVMDCKVMKVSLATKAVINAL